MHTCPICKSTQGRLVLTIGEWSVRQCPLCSHGVTEPFPDENTLASLYSADYFKQHYHDTIDAGDPAFGKRLQQESGRIRFVKKFKKSGTLLDIGCGRGFFLCAAKKKGFIVQGQDITSVNSSYCKKIGIPIYIGRLADMGKTRCFDIITMWHTLEHHPDPFSTIEECSSLLRENGVLFIEVPNISSLDAQVFAQKWPGWSLPFHLHHFSRSSLEKMLHKKNMKVIGVKTSPSEFILDKYTKKLKVKEIARVIARRYEGGSVLVACIKQK